MMSLPPRPRMLSLPPLATMTSGPLVPTIVLEPSVPTIVAWCPSHIGVAAWAVPVVPNAATTSASGSTTLVRVLMLRILICGLTTCLRRLAPPESMAIGCFSLYVTRPGRTLRRLTPFPPKGARSLAVAVGAGRAGRVAAAAAVRAVAGPLRAAGGCFASRGRGVPVGGAVLRSGGVTAVGATVLVLRRAVGRARPIAGVTGVGPVAVSRMLAGRTGRSLRCRRVRGGALRLRHRTRLRRRNLLPLLRRNRVMKSMVQRMH